MKRKVAKIILLISIAVLSLILIRYFFFNNMQDNTKTIVEFYKGDIHNQQDSYKKLKSLKNSQLQFLGYIMHANQKYKEGNIEQAKQIINDCINECNVDKYMIDFMKYMINPLESNHTADNVIKKYIEFNQIVNEAVNGDIKKSKEMALDYISKNHDNKKLNDIIMSFIIDADNIAKS